ncbi:hypothetical protein ACQY0O_002804 [Thecaphora frezii]
MGKKRFRPSPFRSFDDWNDNDNDEGGRSGGRGSGRGRHRLRLVRLDVPYAFQRRFPFPIPPRCYGGDRRTTRKGQKGAGGGGGLSSLPMVKSLVDQIASRSTLRLDAIHHLQPQPDGFSVRLALRIANIGPVKAKVSFPRGLLISPADATVVIATVHLPPLKIRPSIGAATVVDTVATVRGPAVALARLVADVLSTGGSLAYTIRTEAAEVKAYKLRLGAIRFEKQIQLAGLDRLGGAIRMHTPRPTAVSQRAAQATDSVIDGFEIVGGSVESGIEIRTTFNLENASNIGAELGA